MLSCSLRETRNPALIIPLTAICVHQHLHMPRRFSLIQYRETTLYRRACRSLRSFYADPPELTAPCCGDCGEKMIVFCEKTWKKGLGGTAGRGWQDRGARRNRYLSYLGAVGRFICTTNFSLISSVYSRSKRTVYAPRSSLLHRPSPCSKLIRVNDQGGLLFS